MGARPEPGLLMGDLGDSDIPARAPSPWEGRRIGAPPVVRKPLNFGPNWLPRTPLQTCRHAHARSSPRVCGSDLRALC